MERREGSGRDFKKYANQTASSVLPRVAAEWNITVSPFATCTELEKLSGSTWYIQDQVIWVARSQLNNGRSLEQFSGVGKVGIAIFI